MKKKTRPKISDSGRALIGMVLKIAAMIAASTYLLYGLMLLFLFVRNLHDLKGLPYTA